MKNTIKILVLSLGILLIATNVFSHEISDSDQQKMLEAGYFQYIQLGASHMLTGYDHLLFLFGVIDSICDSNDSINSRSSSLS